MAEEPVSTHLCPLHAQIVSKPNYQNFRRLMMNKYPRVPKEEKLPPSNYKAHRQNKSRIKKKNRREAGTEWKKTPSLKKRSNCAKQTDSP